MRLPPCLLAAAALLVLSNGVSRARCFNLETRLPIVKKGDDGSYFGYSVAGHQSMDESKGTVEHSWILVGAPLGQNLQPKTNQSGALWKCPLTSLHKDCTQVITDGRRNDNGIFNSSVDSVHLSPPSRDEVKDGQWLGVVVRSQGRGRKVMVCAHRYINRMDGNLWGLGLCYALTQNLDFLNCLEPCKGLETEKGHSQFGYCQAGTSGLLLEDDSVVIGSPGSYNWKGNIFLNSVSDEYLHGDYKWYHSPIRDAENSPIASLSYLGMSTTAAVFFGNGTMVFAVGAPRANGTGQVVLFSKFGVGDTKQMMDVKYVISGEQFASSFGYELATADLNGDKEPDLIVGAPFHFTKESGGAVYIYMNNKEHCFKCKSPIRLVGKPESRFGFAITNLGDLNNDGYDDIAIGAPYEGNGVIYIYLGSNLGIVEEPSQIIKAEDLVVKDLKIRTLGYSLSGNGVDLDQNGYPDLISGAYESDMVVLIRARPIVNIFTREEVPNIDPTKTGCPENRTSSVTCFTFKTCCSLESVIKTGSSGKLSGVLLHYKLEAETFQDGRKFSRIWFGPNHPLKPHIIENNFRVNDNENETCQQHTAYLKENTMDIQSRIALHISYSLVQNDIPTPGDQVPPLADFPILNQNQAEKTFFATFHKDCKKDICESDVHLDANLVLPNYENQANEYELLMGQHIEVLLNTTAYNNGESAYESKMFITHPYSFNYIGTVKLDDTKQVDCIPFNKTMVVCAIGNPFKKSAVSKIQLRFDPKELNDTEDKLEFIVSSNSTSYEVQPQGALILRVSVIKRAELSLKGSARPEHVFYGGQLKENSAVKFRDEVGSRVLHTYQVYNSGPWKVSNLEINIDWPYQVATHDNSDKWLLYMDESPYVESLSGGNCFMSPRQVNPLDLSLRPGVQETSLDNIRLDNIALNNHMASKSSTNMEKNSSTGYNLNRIRREQNYVIGTESYVKDRGIETETRMDCLLGNARCFKFHCRINNLQKNQEATIFIKARLWNATLLKEVSKTNLVRIVSRAKIHIPPNLSLQQNRSDDEYEVETFAKLDLFGQQETKSIAWWIIILAILAGISLLILLTLLLWKLGFFKRQRPDPTLSGNIEKHRVDDNYYDY